VDAKGVGVVHTCRNGCPHVLAVKEFTSFLAVRGSGLQQSPTSGKIRSELGLPPASS
jgi:hypothetical protein